MKNRNYCVYILTNKHKTLFYIGATGNLEIRLIYHYFTCKYQLKNSFTSRYNCIFLIYYEACQSWKETITREKQIKKYSRFKKHNLVSTLNPNYHFLNHEFTHWPPDEKLLEAVKNETL